MFYAMPFSMAITSLSFTILYFYDFHILFCFAMFCFIPYFPFSKYFNFCNIFFNIGKSILIYPKSFLFHSNSYSTQIILLGTHTLISG